MNESGADLSENKNSDKDPLKIDPTIDAIKKIIIYLGANEKNADDVVTLLTAIVFLIGSIGTGYGVLTRRWNINLKRRFFDPFFKLASQSEIKVSNILLVGDGGSGKTTLVRALSGATEINPYKSTELPEDEKLLTYVISKEFQGEESHHIHRIYIEDYRGQNLTLMKDMTNFTDRCEKLGGGVVIFVVDLFYPPVSGKAPTKPQQHWDSDRISEILREYSPHNVVSDISKLCVDRTNNINTCKMVCLFINKFDMLNNHGQKRMEEVIEEYRMLIRVISNYFNGNEPKIIVGSLDKGWGVCGPYKESMLTDSKSLYEYLLECAVKLD